MEICEIVEEWRLESMTIERGGHRDVLTCEEELVQISICGTNSIDTRYLEGFVQEEEQKERQEKS